MLLESIENLLRVRIGLNAASLGPHAIELAVKARIAARGLRGVADYAGRLESDPVELACLIEEVVVPETWFFREPEAMRLVAARARIALDAGRGFRVLSVPCASGEEPYSVAMALLDAGIPAARFGIDALDVSERALEVARRGVYGANSFRGKDLAFRERYFRAAGDRYQIDDQVRGTVRFQAGNLVHAQLLEGERPYDAIFCRNVLIYLHAAARKTALISLERLLAPDGVLLAGHAEALESMSSGFQRAGKGAAFAYVKAAPQAPKLPSHRPALSAASRTAPAPAPAETRARAPAPSSIETAIGLADRGELRAAAEHCERQIADAGPSARAFCVLGVIRRAEGDLQAAEQCFNKALYLEPAHSEALLHMALIHESRGENASAQRLRRRAERAARSGGAA
jgi:chemotaxis protein methyltransferase WspC